MDKILLLIVLQIVCVFVSAPGQGASPAPVRPPMTTPAKGPVAVQRPVVAKPVTVAAEPPKPVPAYQLYSYYGDRYRDPFIALTGEYRSDQGTDRPPQISTLLLKGIIQDEKGRVALLTSGASSYIL